MKKKLIITDIDKVINSTTSTLSDEDRKALLEIQSKIKKATSNEDIMELLIQLVKLIAVGTEVFINHNQT